MPRYPSRMLPKDWQVVSRMVEIAPEEYAKRYFLQRRRPEDGLWEDFAGPYTGSGSAHDRYNRMRMHYLHDERRAGEPHGHEWRDEVDRRRCMICGLVEQKEARG